MATTPARTARPTISAADVERAMLAVAGTLAAELPAGADAGIVCAARQPVMLAATFADLCAALGISRPAFVAAALD